MGSVFSKIDLARSPKLSVSKRQRYRWLVLGLLLPMGLGLTIALSLAFGSVSLTRLELWTALLQEGSPINQAIVWELRLPRVLAAIVVGSALGMSGAIQQGMLRNGLASPFLLGI